LNVKQFSLCSEMGIDIRVATMHKPSLNIELILPLELHGYEANTAQEVFVLSRELDAKMQLSLDDDGYVRRTNIVLTDGQIVDGWVKV
jgi:hypothetical protein